jgi:hypothetical protein
MVTTVVVPSTATTTYSGLSREGRVFTVCATRVCAWVWTTITNNDRHGSGKGDFGQLEDATSTATATDPRTTSTAAAHDQDFGGLRDACGRDEVAALQELDDGIEAVYGRGFAKVGQGVTLIMLDQSVQIRPMT